MKSQYIKDLKVDAVMNTTVYVVKAEINTNDDNKKFWGRVIARDKTGEITIMIFGFPRATLTQFVEEANTTHYASVKGVVGAFNGSLNVKADEIQAIQAPDDLTDYELSSPRLITDMRYELDTQIDLIQDTHMRKLVDMFIGPKGNIRNKFETWPAAKYKHHSYKHGLLEHTLEVALFCEADIALADKIHRPILLDILRAGALLHDMGKVSEIEISDSGDYGYTSKGELLGHIVLAYNWVAQAFAYHIKDAPKEISEHISHLILSHHGKKEWGSPVEPKTHEAHILHLADMKSAQMFIMGKERAKGISTSA